VTTGTGLDAQFGYKLETTYGTPVTVDKFQEFNGEGPIAWVPTFLEPSGLRSGTKHKRATRVVQSRQEVSGSVELEFATRNMGTLVKLMLGSSVSSPTLISGTAYKQVHTPGDLAGKSATFQIGRPEAASPYTVRPHTYAGVKVVGWEFSVSDGEFAMLNLDVNGRSEATATALATASYTTGASVFNFSQASNFKLGGTPTTAAGETTIASGVAVPGVVTGITVAGNNAMATERFGLGNSGLKNEPLENAIPTITGTMSAEYDRTTFYDVFKANTTTAIQLDLVGSQIAATGSFDTLSFIIPAAKFKNVTPTVSGPDIVQADVEWEAYSNEVDPVIQIKLISADSAAL
jgi:hypothetical protein